MKILMVNKFLHPNGGSETYIFKLGEQLQSINHEVEYFGMEHPGRIVGNRAGAYTANMDFHTGGKLRNLSLAFKTIYSQEARKKLRLVLDSFRPDVVHLNNFNFQLTPSIILETKRWAKRNRQNIRIVFTAHDYQLICPNHLMRNPVTRDNCALCAQGRYSNCLKYRCIHGSALKSLVGMIESRLWHSLRVYRHINTIICPSHFMKRMLDQDPLLKPRTIVMHNFIDDIPWQEKETGNYVLYFGRYDEVKGIRTLISACKNLPDIHFVFAGSGPLEDALGDAPNIENRGFQTGDALTRLIREARFSIYPAEWYENCPFAVMESQQYGTPVLGADIGGIPELIEDGVTGELFPSGDAKALEHKIRNLWDNPLRIAQYSSNCKMISFDTAVSYCDTLLEIYNKGM